MNVEEVMTTRVATVRTDTLLACAAREMLMEDLSCLPVVDPADESELAGILTDRDLFEAVVRSEGKLGGVVAGDVMRPIARWCWAKDSVEAAEAIMRAHSVRRLPVVTPDGKLIGLVTLSDIARAALRRIPGGGEPRPEEAVETLAALSA